MNIRLTATTVEIELSWDERLWACHLGQVISVPLERITEVFVECPMLPWYAIRAPGTAIPGLFVAGTFYTHQGREFWYTTRQSPCLILSVVDEYYKRIVLSVENGSDLGDRLKQLVHSQKA